MRSSALISIFALLFVILGGCASDGERPRASSPPGYPSAFGGSSGAGDPSAGMRDQPEPEPDVIIEDEEEPEQER